MRASWRWAIALATLLVAACGGVEQDAELAPPGQYHGEAMGMSNLGTEQPGAQEWMQSQAYSTTVCLGTTRTYGLDVSYYQGSVNWTSVRAAGKRFAFIRFSDGTGYLDPNFGTNWSRAKAAGMTVGAYQFFRPNQDPTAQADLLVNKLIAIGGTARPNLAPVVDLEVTGGMSTSTILSRLNTWLNRVSSRTGRVPILYTSPGFWNSLGAPYPAYLPYLWVAHWGVSCPSLPYPWTRLRWWQYSSTGSVSGISGAVDLDVYNGSLTEMQGL